ncbi:alpha/beta hydrolase fold domain-containing protein [Sphingobacterium thalpophilum]|uniref:alpha/beta hydrolase fold domain-containing protein n=1 Tax=Sphingobacterium thalpophilum TaxID=259 RepID=UPI003DA56FAB
MSAIKILHLVTFLFILFTGAQGIAQTDSPQRIILDYAYGQDSLQKMDVYLVENRTVHTPLLILVHGGGWMAGDKSDFNSFKDMIFPMGVNVININYRLADNEHIHYKEIMHDIGSAISALKSNTKAWNIRPKDWIMWGNSAGGHLSLLYGYQYDVDKQLSAVVSFAGPVKLDNDPTMAKAKPEDVRGLLPLIAGAPFSEAGSHQAYKDASPYYSAQFIPTLLIHGTKDDIVPIEQSDLLHKLLIEKNVPTDFIVLTDGDHGGHGATESSLESFRTKVKAWITNYSQ